MKNFITKPMITKAEKALATRKANQFKRKLDRGTKWVLAIMVASAISGRLYYALAFELPRNIEKDVIIPKTSVIEKNVKNPLTVEERIIKAANDENIDVLLKLAYCESKFNEQAIHVNKGSVDLGVFQINSVHKDISPTDKLNVEKATIWTLKKIKEGKGHIWVCWDKI